MTVFTIIETMVAELIAEMAKKGWTAETTNSFINLATMKMEIFTVFTKADEIPVIFSGNFNKEIEIQIAKNEFLATK